MVGFSPIAPTIADIYGCKVQFVEVQALIFVIMYLPANFAVIYVQNRYGLKPCMIIGASLLLLGAWLRSLIYVVGRFEVAFAGTIIAAFSQGFFINSSSKLASLWFGDKERALSTALGGLAMPIGCILGFVIPAAMISEEDGKDPVSGNKKFGLYLLV